MKINAYAKVNLALDVCSKRADGYHIIDSVMQSVSLCDVVTIKKADEIRVACSLEGLSGEENSASAAAREFFKATGISGGADIYIEKNIPLSAGLGGGSADAAAVINGLDILYSSSLTAAERCEIGLKIGADVPFCIMGGTMRAGGIGEILIPLPPCPKCFLVIAKQGVKGSTAQMYHRLDSENPPHPDVEGACRAIAKGSLIELSGLMGNSFAEVNDFAELAAEFKKTSPLCAALSGSGPSVFGVYETKAQALAAEESLKSQGINAFFATLKNCGTKIE